MFEKLKELVEKLLRQAAAIKANGWKKNIEVDTESKSSLFSSSDDSLTTSSRSRRQYLLSLGIMFGLLLGIFILIKLPSNWYGLKKKAVKEKDNGNITVEVASKALDPEKMWRNHFEDKLTDTNNQVTEQIKKVSDGIVEQNNKQQKIYEEKIKSLEEKLRFTETQLREGISEVYQVKESMSQVPFEKEEGTANITIHDIAADDRRIAPPRSSKLFIPETAYVTGVLLGGINVSTGVGSSSEPVPVSIRVTDIGNLPKSFKQKMKKCRILGSCYGDLSSERAIVRAEVLSCEDEEEELITTTKMVGIIYGDDGMNGIKGRVVSMSGKHIKNAAIGGVLSGLAKTAKADSNFAINNLGAFSQSKRSTKDKLKDNSLSGIGSAAEKLADYHIKQAESMSPVLIIPGGTKVNVMFTKGVYFGSTDVKRKIEESRSAVNNSSENNNSNRNNSNEYN